MRQTPSKVKGGGEGQRCTLVALLRACARARAHMIMRAHTHAQPVECSQVPSWCVIRGRGYQKRMPSTFLGPAGCWRSRVARVRAHDHARAHTCATLQGAAKCLAGVPNGAVGTNKACLAPSWVLPGPAGCCQSRVARARACDHARARTCATSGVQSSTWLGCPMVP
jgi:hypothetical protein